MVTTTKRRKIEILLDAPLLNRIRKVADEVGLTGYTLYPTVGGEGGQGRWREDQVTGGAGSKLLFTSITGEEETAQFLGAIENLLDEYGLMVTVSNVEVIRGERF